MIDVSQVKTNGIRAIIPGGHLPIGSVYSACVSLIPRKESKAMYKRINITLPESTVRLMERVAGKGERSRLVDEALKQYLRGVTSRGYEEESQKEDQARILA